MQSVLRRRHSTAAYMPYRAGIAPCCSRCVIPRASAGQVWRERGQTGGRGGRVCFFYADQLPSCVAGGAAPPKRQLAGHPRHRQQLQPGRAVIRWRHAGIPTPLWHACSAGTGAAVVCTMHRFRLGRAALPALAEPRQLASRGRRSLRFAAPSAESNDQTPMRPDGLTGPAERSATGMAQIYLTCAFTLETVVGTGQSFLVVRPARAPLAQAQCVLDAS